MDGEEQPDGHKESTQKNEPDNQQNDHLADEEFSADMAEAAGPNAKSNIQNQP